jgi:hypothetical protein
MAPAAGLEPATKRLTAARSTTELRRNETETPWRAGLLEYMVGVK